QESVPQNRLNLRSILVFKVADTRGRLLRELLDFCVDGLEIVTIAQMFSPRLLADVLEQTLRLAVLTRGFRSSPGESKICGQQVVDAGALQAKPELFALP